MEKRRRKTCKRKHGEVRRLSARQEFEELLGFLGTNHHIDTTQPTTSRDNSEDLVSQSSPSKVGVKPTLQHSQQGVDEQYELEG